MFDRELREADERALAEARKRCQVTRPNGRSTIFSSQETRSIPMSRRLPIRSCSKNHGPASALEPDMENIKHNWVDSVVALTKGAAGAIPYAGGLVGELLGTIIPHQRLDRMSRFLEQLAVRVSRLEPERLKAKLTDHETIDLLEDGIIQATRALSDERLRYLSALLAGNIAEDSSSYQETKRLLAIMSELTDWRPPSTAATSSTLCRFSC